MKILSVKLKTVIITAVILLAAAAGVFFLASTVNEAVYGENRKIPIYAVDTNEQKIAVTFNCANGNSDIDTILETLDKYDVKATFFMLGSWAEKNPDSVKKIASAGHEIGNHSYSHKDMPSLSFEDAVNDIRKCNDVLLDITGKKVTLFRAPSGSYDDKTVSAAEEIGMTTIQWSVDTIDWKNISADEIIQKVTSKAHSGDIIQLHTGTEHTAEALPEILSFLKKENYSCVTVGELILKNNYYIDNNGIQKCEKETN